MPGQRSMACTASLACVHSEATTTCTGFTAMARCHTGLSSAPARRPDLYMWERGQGLQCRVWTGTARFLALRMRLCIQGGCWERLSAHVWVCPHAPPTQHRSDRGQRALPAAHRPYSGAPLTPWHAGCGIASQEQFPHAAPPPDNPLLRAGCWREREQHLAAGLRHCACAPLPPTSLVCVTRPLTARQCAAAAAHAHQIVSPLTARSCPSKPELLPARPCRPRFDALANADASQAAAASSTAGAASRSQQESTAFVLGPLGKTFLPRHEEPALTLWQGPCSCCFLSVGGLDLSDALWLGLRTVTN